MHAQSPTGLTNYAVEADFRTVSGAFSVADYTKCEWYGMAPFCDGKCPNDWTTASISNCGDGDVCISGNKVLCCL